MNTKNKVLIILVIIIIAIICYFYFKTRGHKNLFKTPTLFYGDKVVYVGPEDMKPSVEGTQYSFSIWIRPNNLYLNTDWGKNSNTPKTIINNNGSPNIIYLIKDNKINIQIAYYGIDDTIDLYNIEMPKFESQKWTNLIITVDNKIVNVYKNGLIYTSKKLFNPNVKNYKLMNIGEKYNNFNGYIGRIDYYNYVLSSVKANNIYEKYKSYHPDSLMSYEQYEFLKKDTEENKINTDKFKNFFV
jgi:hypothetical protein